MNLRHVSAVSAARAAVVGLVATFASDAAYDQQRYRLAQATDHDLLSTTGRYAIRAKDASDHPGEALHR